MDTNRLVKYLIVVCLVKYGSTSQVTLRTTLGNVTGIEEKATGTVVHKFLGIPYAKPPVGNLRFAKSQPHGPFTDGSLNATAFGSICPQMAGSVETGSEDCLFLNIYAPPKSSAKKSVMIWTHGGGFTSGSSNLYSGDGFVAVEDVIIVTINYRLNAFGFLSAKDDSLPGNFGLWDQRLAIQWVSANIADYGGNPSSVTLFGESAGAFLNSYQMVSPLNNASLFQRVITESGSALSPEFIKRECIPTFESVVMRLGCFFKENLIRCLRSKSVSELLKVTVTPFFNLTFHPVVDGELVPKDIGAQLNKFIEHGHSSNLTIEMGNFASYDLLSGWNDQEGLLFTAEILALNQLMTGKDLSKGISDEVLTAALIVEYDQPGLPVSLLPLIADIFKNFYMNTPHMLVSDHRSDDDRRLETYINIVGDTRLRLATVQHLQLHSVISQQKTFAYQFSHFRNSTGYWYEGPDWLRTGSDHADEIPYVFGFPLVSNTYSKEERELSQKMLKCWANFAKTGHPGVDFEEFVYPRNQTYTVLKTGEFEKLDYPVIGARRLKSAVNGAIVQAIEHVSSNKGLTGTMSSDGVTRPGSTSDGRTNGPMNIASNQSAFCSSVKDEYLSGMLKLTREQANEVMTGILVVAIVLTLLLVAAIISLVTMKVKMMRSSKA